MWTDLAQGSKFCIRPSPFQSCWILSLPHFKCWAYLELRLQLIMTVLCSLNNCCKIIGLAWNLQSSRNHSTVYWVDFVFHNKEFLDQLNDCEQAKEDPISCSCYPVSHSVSELVCMLFCQSLNVFEIYKDFTGKHSMRSCLKRGVFQEKKNETPWF
jgi:hypothetical protein